MRLGVSDNRPTQPAQPPESTANVVDEGAGARQDAIREVGSPGPSVGAEPEAPQPDAAQLDALLQRGFRYALSLVHDRGEAEDLLQEACLRLARKGGPWKAGYLLTTLRNVFIDDYRRRRKILFQPLGELDPATEGPHPERDEALERALGLLKDEEREMVYLQAVEGYSAGEIASLVGRPRGTVLSKIHRAKQRLRQLLGGARTRDAS
jgi:RNA polymerase sigma-70 factor, ECF subfamily